MVLSRRNEIWQSNLDLAMEHPQILFDFSLSIPGVLQVLTYCWERLAGCRKSSPAPSPADLRLGLGEGPAGRGDPKLSQGG